MTTATLQGFRLSPQQRRAWLTQQDGAALASQSLVRLDGELDAVALAAALGEAVRRHEILRTAFQRVPGLKLPVQVVAAAADADAAAVALDRHDLTRLAAAEQAAEVDRLVGLDRRRPFDLAAGLPLRAALLRLGERSHRLLLTLAPVCADSATLRNLVREIAHGYAAHLGAGEPRPDPMQYADFAEWQNDWLAGDEAAEGKDYWRRQDLSGLDAAVLPGESGGEASPVFACGTVTTVLATGELRAAEELARRCEAPLAAVLLGAWQSLLARLAGRSEMVVGAVCDGRSYAEIADALGPFARTLPLRCAVAGHPFRAVVRRAGTALGEAAAWQDYFVADEVLPAGEGEVGCVPYAFELDERPAPLTAGGLRLAVDRQFHCAERFALRLVCSRSGETAAAELQYDSRLCSPQQAARVAGQWRRLLAALLADPEREAVDVDVLDPAERRLLVEERNRTAAPFPSELGIHQLVEAQAMARPDAPALLHGERVVTYAELDRRAGRLARALVDLGVRPGSVVALGSDRTPEAVAALLAVLKAGAAYVALDAEQPPARLRHLLEETAPAALLLPRDLAGSLPEHPVRLFLDDEPAPSAAGLPAADSGRLAYVVFTSGSTGRPKGVLASHRGVVNYLTFLRTAYGLGEADVVLQIPDLTFDSSVRDLLGPLAAGARVVLIEKGLAKDPRTLLRKVRDHGVTCLLSVVPTLLRALLDAAAAEPAPSGRVRLVLASGEVLRAADGAGVERLFGPGARLFNQYGPTECTMTSSFHPVPQGLAEGDRTPLPIGRPIPNARFYLLDERRLPVPAGTPGELYIGGEGLAAGYLNAPGPTAERFVADPFAAAPGSRLYRTGDLAVYRPDGGLEFGGRVDQQVKLRGVRVEPEEIEAALLEHPAVQRAVVVLREDVPGDLRLAAYVVLSRRPAVELPAEGRYVLPNRMLIAQQNRYETDFFYEQIFVDQVEFRHGVTLADGDVVFDVGANIGLFSLFVHQMCRRPRLFSFEPIPEIFATLRTNVELYGLGARLFNCGLSDHEGPIRFSYYPHSSCQSGYYADAVQETRMLHGIIARQKPGAGAVLEGGESRYLDELVAERMASRAVDCPLKTLSQVLRENGLDRIDLLKIDTEKAELDVLRGIGDADWPKIRQIVIEGHDLDGRLAQVVALLESRGCEVVVEKDEMLAETCLFNVYAFRDRRLRSTRQRPLVERLPLANGELLSTEELRLFLRARLPEVMVPAAFVILDSLPTTPNGKLDRRALPAPVAAEAGREEAREAARTPTEEIVAGVWTEVLKLGEVDVRDDFFARGGHSLLATQVILRINETFQVAIPLRTLFDAPTVEGLARVVDQAALAQRGVQAPPLAPAPRDRALPLSFAQQRLWFLDQLQPGNPRFNLASAVRIRGPLDLAVLQRTLDEIVRRHESLRTTFTATADGPVQRIAPSAPVPLPVNDLSGWGAAEREAEVARLLAKESGRGFDLAAGPLLRVLVVRGGEQEHVVHLGMHHVVGDAWSMGVLARELTALFAAFSRGAASPLPELPVQYPDFAVWQRAWLRGEVLAAHLGFWQRQLAGAPPLLALPLDRPRPAVAGFRGARHTLVLPPDLAGELAALGRRQGVTAFMTLLAALQALLRFFGAGDDVVVGADVANRTRAETEGLIGFFINQIVLRTDLAGDPAFPELLARVRRTAMDAYAHQDLPFDRLVEALRPERSLDHAPLFQVKLVLQNTPRSSLELPSGLTLAWLPLESAPAGEDLLLNAVETAAGLAVTFKYNADLFAAATIARMAAAFDRLLRRVAGQPEVRLSELDAMLAAADREWRAGQAQAQTQALEQRLKTFRRRATSR